MTTTTGAELLREAARLMRARADAATPGPWSAGKYHDNHAVMAGAAADCWVASTGVYRPSIGPLGAEEDAQHIASWHPAVALAVADWLDWVADAWDQTARLWNVERGEKHGRWNEPTEHQALTVARAYLAVPVSAGEGHS